MNDFIEDYLLEKTASNSSSLENMAQQKGTTQFITFNIDGSVQKIEDKNSNSEVVRLVEYVYTATTITETIKINGVLNKTIITNLDTFETEVN